MSFQQPFHRPVVSSRFRMAFRRWDECSISFSLQVAQSGTTTFFRMVGKHAHGPHKLSTSRVAPAMHTSVHQQNFEIRIFRYHEELFRGHVSTRAIEHANNAIFGLQADDVPKDVVTSRSKTCRKAHSDSFPFCNNV